jgi:putative aldouronate transport system substrate-binding protein
MRKFLVTFVCCLVFLSSIAFAKNYLGKMPLTKTKVTLTGIIPSIGSVSNMKTNRLNNLLEQRTNVHINWVETSQEQFRDKLSIMAAAGECPDIIFEKGRLGKQDYEKFGQQGVLADLTPYINKNSYYLKQKIKKDPRIKSYITSSNKKVYFLPTLYGAYHLSMTQKYWINQKWLDNLGLKTPTTTAEFYHVLKAFKEKDPNGNGKKDEIPMTGALRAQEDTASFILSSFIPVGSGDNSGDITLNCYEFIIKNKVTFTANRPEFREGLRYIKKLYDEGLYDPAAFTQKREQIMPLVDGGDATRIGGMVSHHPGNFSSTMDIEKGRFREYAAMLPLKGPKGFASTPWLADSGKQTAFAISKRCKYPEIAFMWADYCYNDEISTISALGFEGEHWKKAAPGAIGINGQPAKYYLFDQKTGTLNNVHLGYYGPQDTYGFNDHFVRKAGFSYDAMLYDATKAMEPFKVKRYPYLTVGVPLEEMTEFYELRKTLHSLIGEWVDRFILGDKSIEKDWDAYLKQLQSVGLNRYMTMLKQYNKK